MDVQLLHLSYDNSYIIYVHNTKLAMTETQRKDTEEYVLNYLKFQRI